MEILRQLSRIYEKDAGLYVFSYYGHDDLETMINRWDPQKVERLEGENLEELFEVEQGYLYGHLFFREKVWLLVLDPEWEFQCYALERVISEVDLANIMEDFDNSWAEKYGKYSWISRENGIAGAWVERYFSALAYYTAKRLGKGYMLRGVRFGKQEDAEQDLAKLRKKDG